MSEEIRTSAGGGIVSTSIVAALTICGIVVVAVWRMSAAFAGGGLTVRVPAPASAGPGQTPSGATMQMTQAIVTVPHPDSGLTVMAVCTILLAAITGIALVGCYFLFFWEIFRGRTFSRRAIRMLSGMAAAVIIGTTGCYLLDQLVTSGVREATGLGEGSGGDTPLSYWMGFAIFGALGLIVQAFRRGERLQHETEGLV